MQAAGLGLCRNRHGNQFHTRIHIPKDLAPMLGCAEVRLSLGTEVRRYAIASARLVHSRKITAFDEMRAVMDNKNTSPTPEQQAEARRPSSSAGLPNPPQSCRKMPVTFKRPTPNTSKMRKAQH